MVNEIHIDFQKNICSQTSEVLETSEVFRGMVDTLSLYPPYTPMFSFNHPRKASKSFIHHSPFTIHNSPFTIHHSPFMTNSGYTLIELLVVLVLFSLLAGIVVPRLTTMYDSLQAAYERDEMLVRLGGLNYWAFQQRRDFVLTAYPDNQDKGSQTNDKPVNPEPLPFELPEGWQLRAETPIRFRANGACTGGIVFLQHQDRKYRVQLKPPFCKPKIL